jgi:putative SOS response-associated peptidase YedK
MVDQFQLGNKTGPAAAPGDPGAVIRRARDGIEMVNLVWGLAPGQPGARPYTVIRSEGRRFPSHRCLIPASEFRLSTGKGRDRRKWRFTLANGDFFYFAGIWRPRAAEWPSAYAALTTAANPDIAPYHDRQMAVVLRADRMAWLDLTRPEEALLKPLPAKSFRVELEEGPPGVQSAFGWGVR